MAGAEMFFDVAVIGGGGAALRAALSAWQRGAKTALLCKKEAGKSGATYYSVAEVGAFNVPDGAMDQEDTPEQFYQDMAQAALGMAHLPLCRILAEQAEDSLRDLEKLSGGQVFSKTNNGGFSVYQACFSTRPRSHVVENHFKPILKTLWAAVAKTDITVLNRYQAVDLLTCPKGVGGVLALDGQGEIAVIRSKSIILAAGGASQLFRRNMYPADITGDGYAMAYRAGAQLSNLEFIQAGIGIVQPFINLFGNYLWKAFPRIRNASGEDLLVKYGGSPQAARNALAQKTHFPFSCRDDSKLIEIAVQSELNHGDNPENSNVFLDFLDTDFKTLLREDPAFASMWKFTYQWHRDRDINLYEDPIEISCFAHAINGGILINTHAESSLPGLFAAGETAAGPHGADRLGGNMSVTCQVFGKIAGEAAAERAQAMTAFLDVEESVRAVSRRLQKLSTGYENDLEGLLSKLQVASDKHLLIVRSEDGLARYLETLSLIQKELTKGCQAGRLKTLLQLENLTISGKLIATAAQSRRESRGSHYRTDYPKLDPALGNMLILQRQPV